MGLRRNIDGEFSRRVQTYQLEFNMAFVSYKDYGTKSAKPNVGWNNVS